MRHLSNHFLTVTERKKKIPVTPTAFLTNCTIIWRNIMKLYIKLFPMGFWNFLCSYWGNWLSKPTPENVHCSVNLYFIHSRMVWKISAMENNSQNLQRSYYSVKTKHLSCKLSQQQNTNYYHRNECRYS